jgi:hypothetical protein
VWFLECFGNLRMKMGRHERDACKDWLLDVFFTTATILSLQLAFRPSAGATVVLTSSFGFGRSLYVRLIRTMVYAPHICPKKAVRAPSTVHPSLGPSDALGRETAFTVRP